MIELDRKLVDALVNYLASKPYAEVYQLIQALVAAANEEPPKEG